MDIVISSRTYIHTMHTHYKFVVVRQWMWTVKPFTLHGSMAIVCPFMFFSLCLFPSFLYLTFSLFRALSPSHLPPHLHLILSLLFSPSAVLGVFRAYVLKWSKNHISCVISNLRLAEAHIEPYRKLVFLFDSAIGDTQTIQYIIVYAQHRAQSATAREIA